MSAVTVAVLDRHLATLAAWAAGASQYSLLGLVTAYHDALTKAPRAIVVVHLIRAAAFVAWRGVDPTTGERYLLTAAGRDALERRQREQADPP